jgi:uncharacterized membrane protein
MNPAAAVFRTTSEPTPTAWLKAAHWLGLGAFLTALGLVWTGILIPAAAWRAAGWPDAALVLAAAIATLLSLARQLPLQNVLLAAGVIALIGGAVSAVGAHTGIPFGPHAYTRAAGPRLFGLLPWPVPLIWVVAILNARGVARLILRPWRMMRTYGFRLIGLTTGLSLAFELAWEPFATRARHYWLWTPTRFPFDWYGAPLTDFVAWTGTVLLMLAFATPALINKKPARFPPDFHPLLVWVLLNLLFATVAAAHHFWMAAVFSAALALVTTLLAGRAARWGPG